MVRMIHASEMTIVHTVPKLTSEQKASAVIVKCSGKHHKDLLHEMVDHYADAHLEVLHAEIDEEGGEEVILFWIKREDDMVIAASQREEIQEKLMSLYSSHSVTANIQIGDMDDWRNNPSLVGMHPMHDDPTTASGLSKRRARASKESLELVEKAKESRERRNTKDGPSPDKDGATTSAPPSPKKEGPHPPPNGSPGASSKPSPIDTAAVAAVMLSSACADDASVSVALA